MSDASLLKQICRGILRGVERWTPPEHVEWARAARAELEEIRDAWESVQWAFGGLVLLVWFGARSVFAQPDGWILATLLGAAAAAIDLRIADSRLPLIVMCLAAAMAMGILYRRAAWRWGAAIALMLPLLAWWTQFHGPYFHDRADAWYPLLPTIAAAVCGSWLAGRWRRWHKGDNDVAISET